MCENCKQNELNPEFEMLFHETDENDYSGAFAINPGSHPDLGKGRLISKQGEMEWQEFEATAAAYHPSLGRGKIIPKSSEIKGEFEIVGTDERVLVNNTKDVPFRWVCHLDLFFPDPDNASAYLGFGGSGVLISPRHILTAGHCLYSRVTGSKKTSAVVQVAKIRATPGRNGALPGPFGSAVSVNVQYSNQWRASRDYRFDYGLITLAEDIGTKPMAVLGGKPLGFWSSPSNGSGTRINPKERGFLQGISINISGYPGDKPEGTQWRAFDKISNAIPSAGKELIYYAIDTCAGHSGAPVWLRWQQYRNLIAIHTGPCIPGIDCSKVPGGKPCFPGDPNSSRYTSNRGILITDTVMANVKKWMTK